MIAVNSAKHCHLKCKFLCCRSTFSSVHLHISLVTPLQFVNCLHRSQCLGILLELLYIRVITNMPILCQWSKMFLMGPLCVIYTATQYIGEESLLSLNILSTLARVRPLKIEIHTAGYKVKTSQGCTDNINTLMIKINNLRL